MSIYSKLFANYYDSLMGDYSRLLIPTHDLIAKYASANKHLRILELGCGTGTILKKFPKSYELYGLDIAKDMITIAKKKVPYAKLVVGDMTDFSFPLKFDVILCIFDSINHLTAFSQWQKVFLLASKHLTADGIFIFDMNTPKRLQTLTTFPPHVKHLKKDTIAFEKLSEKRKHIFELQIAIIENIYSTTPRAFEEIVEETTFSKEKIIKELNKHFIIEKMLDPFRKRVTKNTGRIFFACRKIL